MPDAQFMTDRPTAQTIAPTIALATLDADVGRRAASLAITVGDLAADYVLPVPPDLRLPAETMAQLAMAVAADPGADAFRLAVKGLDPDPLWRGRRARSHEHNVESLRFANLFPFGALLVRREALLAALAELPADAGDDWWRIVCRRIGQTGRIAELDIAVRRGTRMDGEPAAPAFVALPRSAARVLVLGQIEVSASLYFDFLEAAPDVSIAFRPLTRLALDAPVLASADLVILVRELHRFWDEGVVAFLDAAHVPYVWFTDDNFLALKTEGAARAFYALPRMQAALAKAAAVWASTDALAAAHVWLHPNVGVWKPVLDPYLQQSATPTPSGVLTIALSGGDFRLSGLAGAGLDVLRQLAEGPGLRLLVTPRRGPYAATPPAGGRDRRVADGKVVSPAHSRLAPVRPRHPAASGRRHRQRPVQVAHCRHRRRLPRRDSGRGGGAGLPGVGRSRRGAAAGRERRGSGPGGGARPASRLARRHGRPPRGGAVGAVRQRGSPAPPDGADAAVAAAKRRGRRREHPGVAGVLPPPGGATADPSRAAAQRPDPASRMRSAARSRPL
ncbi:MAG: hypothetical protein WDM85_03470 [Caulobacteraceae bacterium]